MPLETGATTGGWPSPEQIVACNCTAWTRVRGDQTGSEERSAQGK